jgi:hypothetical protein
LALVDDDEVVFHGVAKMFERYPEQIEIDETDALRLIHRGEMIVSPTPSRSRTSVSSGTQAVLWGIGHGFKISSRQLERWR